MHNWRVTADGRRDASLFRVENTRTSRGGSEAVSQSDAEPVELHDAFIAHASEDKEDVARPLAQELLSLGWAVWLDELKLTVGDSLSRRIDTALACSRFGIVVLSPAFFAKEWPQRELAGLAAREIDTGSKVILPVWHNVDYHFIVQHSPVLADRLGALTSTGIERVAREISLVLGQSSVGLSEASAAGSAAEAPEPSDERGPLLLRIPTTDEEQAEIVREQSDWWEYRLYAGVLMQGRIGLEDKWLDHELRLPSGSVREPSESVPDFLSRQTGLISRHMEILNRLFDPDVLEQAFGSSGVAGDSKRIVHIARGVTQTYESMMDWAAGLRSTSVSSEYNELLELTARMVDDPIRQIREFIQLAADQIARIPLFVEEARAKGATKESPMAVDLTLHVELDKENQEKLQVALSRLRSHL